MLAVRWDSTYQVVAQPRYFLPRTPMTAGTPSRSSLQENCNRSLAQGQEGAPALLLVGTVVSAVKLFWSQLASPSGAQSFRATPSWAGQQTVLCPSVIRCTSHPAQNCSERTRHHGGMGWGAGEHSWPGPLWTPPPEPDLSPPQDSMPIEPSNCTRSQAEHSTSR